ncbi:MAG: lysophospholipid acyltransferase family protein [Chitinophagales bacterium]|nr:lysophospholipid acyltransferase family protein [Chitinophagales bacterium]HAE14395.1 hypothetical protein [Bacteroidota bacterium]MCB9021577.1 lysophospholipid acyltransferase family protein [Chitinophagales bacterium]MCB9031170.1 lysophospholipid acyltransferase family protein [Chitinophagales bacterium]HPE96979.1 lysophospholipid acyltransferase family protein [Chitinophagales bacterium]
MKRIAFWVSYPFMLLVAALPLRALYLFSDILYVIIYHLMGYRRRLVWKNLRRSFPEQDKETLRRWRKKFYHFLADTIVETVKTISIRNERLYSRFRFDNLDMISEALQQNRNIMIVLGHYGNWEWGAGAISRQLARPLMAPYAPLRNPDFNRLMVRTRSRYGLQLLPRKQLIPYLLSHTQQKHFLALIADQSPNPKRQRIMQFMNQETAVVTGMESIARDFDFMVYYASTRFVKRGEYACRFELLSEHPAEMKEGDLTVAFMKKLERDIMNDPIHYLWSHNRWKLTTNSKHPKKRHN